MTSTIKVKDINPMKVPKKRTSWNTFQNKYLTREDLYRYEWVNGIVEKTKRDFNMPFMYLHANLQHRFYDLKNEGILAHLVSNILFLNNVHRLPTISYFNKKQIRKMSFDENEIPLFLIEIIQSKDNISKVHERMQNYRDAGVQVVWHLFPNYEEVHVYSGKNLTSMLVCKADDICSAKPVLPNFEISVNDIFKKPPMPE